MFYFDTAINGNTAALMCAYRFCGVNHMLFASDMPYDNEFGARSIRQTINAIQEMDVEDREKTKIFGDNIRRLIDLTE
jgi:predicted TIM-barrel fold metal-dependent hydrolase